MPGRQSTGPPSTAGPKNKKRNTKRSLNALAIAEQQHPAKDQLRQNRLGVFEQGISGHKRLLSEEVTDEEDNTHSRKRRRAGHKDRHGNEVDGGSDSEGNEWVLGQVDSDDDSDLDSDAAMGESDEERFEGFTFYGSSSTTLKPTARKTISTKGSEEGKVHEVDLNEDVVDPSGSEEDKYDLGDDAIDLANALDDDDDDATGTESGSETDQGGFDFTDTSDQDDAADPKKVAFLGDMISNLNSLDQAPPIRHKPTGDGLETQTPSEFALKSSEKLTLADLQATVTDPALRKSLKLLAAADSTKPSSKRGGIPKKLETPLAKRQQDRLNRAAAYEKSKETLNRWIDTVKHNRRSEHISFPLQNPNEVVAQGGHRMVPTTQAKPVTELEGIIQNILQASGLAPTNDKSNEEAVDGFSNLPANNLSLEEVQARRAELRRARDLLFREEKRAKRIKKIKSKSYRKVHRKERERIAEREKAAMSAAGVDDSGEEQEKNDRRRAEERMGQRHRESRWAKSTKDSGRAAWDEGARSAVTEMARRGEELRRRIQGRNVEKNDDASESESSDGYDDDDGEAGGGSKDELLDRLHQVSSDRLEGTNSTLAAMPFMRKASSLRRAQNHAEAETIRKELNGEDNPNEDEPSETIGRRSYGPSKIRPQDSQNQPEQRSDFEEQLPSDNDEIRVAAPEEEEFEIIVDAADAASTAKSKSKQSISRTHMPTPTAPTETRSSYADNPWLSNSKPHRRVPGENSSAPAIISNNPPAKPRSALKGSRAANAPSTIPSTPEPTVLNEHAPDSVSGSEAEAAEPALPAHIQRNRELVARAFAGDEVVADFEAEKAETTRDDDDKVIDTTLPGWGSWVGEGLPKRLQKQNSGKYFKVEKGIAKEQRKDAKLEKVIINEKRVKKNGKYLASSLPHPFETRSQYERSLRLPVGPEWTTKETFQGMTKPRVLMKQGVIEPISRPVI